MLVWQAVGFYVVLFSAGMASIPGRSTRPPRSTGRARVTLFFRVTLPLLWDTLQVAWVYLGHRGVRRVRARRRCSRWTSGGPDGATTVLAMEIYRNAFVYSKYGYASAMGVALFFLTLTFAALTLRLTKRRERRVLMKPQSTLPPTRRRYREDRRPVRRRRAGAQGRGSEVRLFAGLGHRRRSPIWAVIVIVPILWTFLAVVQEHHARSSAARGRCPAELRSENFGRAWTKAHVGRYFLNSVIVVSFSTFGTMLLGSMAAYVLARYKFWGNRAIYLPVRLRAGLPDLPGAGAAVLRRQEPGPAGHPHRPGPGLHRLLAAVHGLLPGRVLQDAADVGGRGGG